MMEIAPTSHPTGGIPSPTPKGASLCTIEGPLVTPFMNKLEPQEKEPFRPHTGWVSYHAL
jgi:hypothetical protein